MDKEKMRLVLEQSQNHGSSFIAILLVMIGLDGLPVEMVMDITTKWFDWYMAASKEELVKVGVLLIAAVVCWFYKKPTKPIVLRDEV